jgi:hypothetical protein
MVCDLSRKEDCEAMQNVVCGLLFLGTGEALKLPSAIEF